MTIPAERTAVPLGRVITDPGLWPREQLHHGRVEEFMLLYRDGGLDALPPLDVVPDGGDLLLGDGWHRHQALTRLGSPTALVRLITGPGDPTGVAYRHGLLTASTAALPLTRAERRAAVIRLLEDQPELADREIARLIGVSPTTVGAYRRHLDGDIDTAMTAEPSAGEQQTTVPTVDQPSPVIGATVGANELALRLARGLEKVWQARGLSDLLLGDRTGRRLAAALRAQHGEDALAWARRLASWSNTCLAELEAAQ